MVGMLGSNEEWQPVTSWSPRGDNNRNPDLVGPGRSIASYRVPDSTADVEVPSARVGSNLFLGSPLASSTTSRG